MINLEIFSCAGGMAEGFRRAGIHFDMAVDFAADHVESYAKNIGHRPIRMDARDLLRMIQMGWSVAVDLLVADPPCTPWSRAGKRQGTADQRDMLEETAEIIKRLRPRRYLIGNVPGLDDQPNWHIVQRVIGGLEKYGYCVADFAALDAANYSVPQRRIRPFWFGHQEGPCIRWTPPTHADPDLCTNHTLPGVDELQPWVTCKQALGHLPLHELGRPVRLRKRAQNSTQHGSVKEKPTRGVGTSNLSDGNVLLTYDQHHPPSRDDQPANTVRADNGQGATRAMQIVVPGTITDQGTKHRNCTPDGVSPTITGGGAGHGARPLVLEGVRQIPEDGGHPPSLLDGPAKTLVASALGSAALVIEDDTKHPINEADQPAFALKGSDGGGSKRVLKLGPSGKPSGGRRSATMEGGYTPSTLDQPAKTVVRNTHGDGTVLVLNDKHPPSDPNAPSQTIGAKIRGAQAASVFIDGAPVAAKRGRKRDQGRVAQGNRVGKPDRPGATLTSCAASRVGGGASTTLEWPWDRPSTTVPAQGDGRIPPPGHHDEDFAVLSLPGAVLLSEKAAAILQGFPETWVFHGKTKKARWSQLGQAMPPPLAHAVALAVVDQERRTYEAKADERIAEIERAQLARAANTPAITTLYGDA